MSALCAWVDGRGHLLVFLGVVTAEKKAGRQGGHTAAVREEELLDQTNQ